MTARSPDPAAETVSALREAPDAFVLIKRGLYWCPNGMGYTGVLSEAGRYTEEKARGHADHPSGVTFMPAAEAPKFSEACWEDTKVKVLTAELEPAEADIAALRTRAEEAERERDEHDLRADRLERERRLLDARIQNQRATLREVDATACRIKELETDRGRAWSKARARKADLLAMARMYGEACGSLATERNWEQTLRFCEREWAAADDATLARLTAATADRDRLADRVAALEAALKPFVFGDGTMETILYGSVADDESGTITIRMGDIRAARRAIEAARALSPLQEERAMPGETLLSYEREGWVIPNGHGQLRTDHIFETESSAILHLGMRWPCGEPPPARVKPVRARVLLSAALIAAEGRDHG